MNSKPSLASLACALSLFITACATQSPALRTVRFADLVEHPEGGLRTLGNGVILEFQPGDRIPFELAFSDQNFALEAPDSQITLVAQRHCYVRIDKHGLKASENGRDFDETPEVPGSFFVGFSQRPGTAPQLTVRIQTPKMHSESTSQAP